MVETLTDTDYVSVIDFSSNALAYAPPGGGVGLVQATEANLELIRTWIDGLRAAGLPSTTLPYYNIAPGVGGDDPNQGRCVFDAFQDSTNKFRDTRRFAQMNNPRIPRGHAYNPLTGDVHRALKAPGVEMAPRDPLRPPPLSSLAQLRPPSSRVEQSASKSAFESTRPW